MTFRIYKIAKEISIPSKEIVGILAEYGITKNHMSVLSEDELNLVFEHLAFLTMGQPLSLIIKEPEPTESRDKTTKDAEIHQINTQVIKDTTPSSGTSKTIQHTIDITNTSDEESRTTKFNKKFENIEISSSKKNKSKISENRFSKPQPVKKKSVKLVLDKNDNAESVESFKTFSPSKQQDSLVINTKAVVVEREKFDQTSEDKIENLVSIKDDNSKKVEKISKKQIGKKITKEITKLKTEEVENKYFEVELPPLITSTELAEKINKSTADVIKALISFGVLISANNSLDFDTASIIVEHFGGKAKLENISEDKSLEEEQDDPADLLPRPPVVVIMGHVDHGKTTVLDTIRKTNVAARESGGITQHIGAYSVSIDGKKITFFDTPGHEAFTEMRQRGARATDLVVLIVSADDGLMPQTKEAISHAKEASVPILVAINKIDKENANPDRVKQQLTEHGLIPEEWGGDTVCVEISAKNNINIDKLLEMIILVTDMCELKANPDRKAQGVIIESFLDKGKGPVATLLVQNGTLKLGDIVIAGIAYGKIRAMTNDSGKPVKKATPSTPVQVIGLSEVASSGLIFCVIEDEKNARQISENRKILQKQEQSLNFQKISLDNLFEHIEFKKMKELNVIIKTDVQGSIEALRTSLEKLSNEEVRVRAIHSSTGPINESDVMLAATSNAIIIGFNIRPTVGAISLAKSQNVDVRTYTVIYDAISDVSKAMKGLFDPVFVEESLGRGEIRQTFKSSAVGMIAGVYVTVGKLQRNGKIRVLRDGVILYDGELSSLKRFKDDAKEVAAGFECGLSIDKFNDVRIDDEIECYVMKQKVVE